MGWEGQKNIETSQIVFSSVTWDVAEPRYVCSVPKKALTYENQRQD